MVRQETLLGGAMQGLRADLLSSLIARGYLPGGQEGAALVGQEGGGRSFDDLLHHLMMTESSHAHHPASEEAMAGLRRVAVDADTDLSTLGECGVTLETFEPGDTAVVLPCSHAYKEEAIVQWLQQHDTCPVCRSSVA